MRNNNYLVFISKILSLVFKTVGTLNFHIPTVIILSSLPCNFVAMKSLSPIIIFARNDSLLKKPYTE